MRLIRRLACVMLLTALVVSCDSDDPLSVGTQTFTIQVDATSAQANQFRVHDFFEDTDGDGQPDNGLFLWCQFFPSAGATGNPNEVPWEFAIEVKVLRAGETVAEFITSSGAAAPDANLTSYDSLETIFPISPGDITVDDNGTLRTFKFCPDPFVTDPLCSRTARLLTAGHRDVVMATSNPLNTIDSVTYAYGSGLCSEGDPGPAEIDGNPKPLDVEIQKGDTVIVTIKRGDLPPEMRDGSGAPTITVPPSLSATTFLDGNQITPDGDTTTDPTVGSTISFTFTSR